MKNKNQWQTQFIFNTLGHGLPPTSCNNNGIIKSVHIQFIQKGNKTYKKLILIYEDMLRMVLFL